MFKVKNVIKVKTPLEEISYDKQCHVSILKNTAQITILKREPTPFSCIRIKGNKYVNKQTGDIFDYSNTSNRKISVASLRKTYKQLESLINNNFSGGNSEVFMTLGYNDIMNDIDKLNHDFNLFWRKLKRRYKNCEYLSVMEYKSIGSLHLHILFKSIDNKPLFFDRDLIIKLWGNSNVYLERIHSEKGVEKISKYLNPFINKKKFDNLKFCERGVRLYRCSKGINKGEYFILPFSNAVELMKNKYNLSSVNSYSIVMVSEDGNQTELNHIKKFKYERIKKYDK